MGRNSKAQELNRTRGGKKRLNSLWPLLTQGEQKEEDLAAIHLALVFMHVNLELIHSHPAMMGKESSSRILILVDLHIFASLNLCLSDRKNCAS